MTLNAVEEDRVHLKLSRLHIEICRSHANDCRLDKSRLCRHTSAVLLEDTKSCGENDFTFIELLWRQIVYLGLKAASG